MAKYKPKNEQAFLMTPGQVFVARENKIIHKQCWMIGGTTMPDDVLSQDLEFLDGTEKQTARYATLENCTRFLIPLLPKDEDFGLFIAKRRQLKLGSDFLGQPEWTFELNVALEDLIDKVADMDLACELPEQLHRLHANLRETAIAQYERCNSEFSQHFYLTPDTNGELLFLEFRDSTYRPEVRRARFQKGNIKYRNLQNSIQKWRSVGVAEIAEIFCGIDNQTIDALNQGAGKLREIRQVATEPTLVSAAKEYDILKQITEVLLVPTIWLDASKERVWLNYDFWADWRTTESGKVYANLGAFQVWHEPSRPQTGWITKRR